VYRDINRRDYVNMDENNCSIAGKSFTDTTSLYATIDSCITRVLIGGHNPDALTVIYGSV
jgi:hypothetical protein